MGTLSFQPNKSKKPTVFGGLQIGKGQQARNFRITHVFDSHLYLMEVTTAAAGHDAQRPTQRNLREIDELRAKGRATYGSIRLPPEMKTAIPKGSAMAAIIGAARAQIQPLLTLFSRESALDRSFTSEIEAKAEKQGIPLASLRRALLRYWYFGGVDHGLLTLRRGRKIAMPDASGAAAVTGRTRSRPPLRRTGPKPRRVVGVRPCDWCIGPADVLDMERAAIRCAKRRLHGLQELTDQYLKVEFKRRHPAVYKQFMNGSTTVPVTARQVQYRLRRKSALDPLVLKAFPTLSRPASQRLLQAVGSGHIYELDATGGQIYIVDPADHTRILRKVTIYLLIDRYSRYVVSIYITAKPASSAGVRQALRIAFTSRARRFQSMGVDINDVEWPPGVICLQIVSDNGPDMISKATLKTAVEDLLIDYDILPPYTPDGKAIVERFIKTLKLRMKAKGLAGLYKKMQFSPEDKQAAKTAVFLAEFTLRALYRELIEIVRQYNHGHHKGLEKRLPELAAAGLPFTPIAAYEYGLEHVSGLQRPALSDEDIFQLTLATQKAKIKGGIVTWQGLTFYPANEAALAFGARFGSTTKAIDVKIDATDPFELFAVSSMTPLPAWKLDSHGEAVVRAVSLEDWDEFSEERAVLQADTARLNAIARQRAPEPSGDAKAGPRKRASKPRSAAERRVVERRSLQESNALDAALSRGATGKHSKRRAQGRAKNAVAPTDYRAVHAAQLEVIAKRRATGGKK